MLPSTPRHCHTDLPHIHTLLCLSSEEEPRFAFGDMGALPAAAVAALVASLRRRGAVRASPALAQPVAAGMLLPPSRYLF